MQVLESCHLACITIKRNKFEIRNVNEISSLSYDRTNSLYKTTNNRWFKYNFKNNGNDV
jgi:hypothetical protein